MTQSSPADAIRQINQWLSQLDEFPLECDGMTRLISTLLTRDGVAHKVHSGYLSPGGEGRMINHFWISLDDNHLIDIRARMWFGERAPHGAFLNGNINVAYSESSTVDDFTLEPSLFEIMIGCSLDQFTHFPVEALPIMPKIDHQALANTVVRDAQGNPLRVFRGEHGAVDSSTTAFSFNVGSITFSTCSVANQYARTPNDKTLWDEINNQARIIPCYLSITNPVINSVDDPYVDFTELVEAIGVINATQAFLRVSDSVEDTNAFHEQADEFDVDSLSELIKVNPACLNDMYVLAWRLLDDPEFIKCCKEHGYDGAIHPGSGESMNAMEYRIFSQEQAVLALSPEISPTQALEITAEPMPMATKKEVSRNRMAYEPSL